MGSRTIESSPQFYARIAGVLYLIIIALGIFGEMFVRSNLIVAGNATATATNIMASETLWRLGSTGQLVMLLCAIPLAVIMYVFLRPVDKSVAILALLFNCVAIAVEALNNLQLFTVLQSLSGAEYLTAFEPQQLHALATLAIKTHGLGYSISLLFFGFNCLAWGYLIYKSGFFPRVIGVMLIVCWLCYTVNSFAWFLAPKFGAVLFPAIVLPCFVAELSLCLWLLFKGLDVAKWQAQLRQTILSD